MPSLKESILFLEDCVESDTDIQNFKRNLQSLVHQKDFSGVKGIVFGKFESEFKMTDNLLGRIIEMHPILKEIPIIANVDIGHTFPQITLPIGGTAKIKAKKGTVSLILSNS
jgi:muramoyltetrapeptide carboxypeptidase LdcA involved in peptidoglycan recycling